MQIAILTFQRFNELDSFIAAAMLNRMKRYGWTASITSPADQITSMNGITIYRQKPLEFATEADAVLIGSGVSTRELADDEPIMERINLDSSRQLVGAQCSGTLLLAKLGLIGDHAVCTDLTTKKLLVEAGIGVLDAPFTAHDNVATAGGCLAAQYLATWVIARNASLRHAEEVLQHVAPVGEKTRYVDRALEIVAPFLPDATALTRGTATAQPNSFPALSAGDIL